MLHRTKLTAPLWLLSSALLATGALGCSSEDPKQSTDDVTDIDHTDVKDQSIGNCWVYATMGWGESLHLIHTGVELDLSESWITYWHWFEQIAGGAPGQGQLAFLRDGKIATGGWYGIAGELMLRYGLIDEGGFIPEEAEDIVSNRQKTALNAINQSLESGVLSDPAARNDPATVRAELNAAWELSPEVIAMMDQVFGADTSNTLYNTSTALPEGSTMRYAHQIPVGQNITLADAIGQPASSFNFKDRVGQFAWTEQDYPSGAVDRRQFLKKFQQNLHAGMPVIMTWYVDFNALGDDGAFRAPPETPGRSGGHMVLAEDYQVNNVPGFGTLVAGETVTDPAILDAALADEAVIEFIRIKNSWGTELAPQTASEEFRGYHDLFMEYLNGPIKKCVDDDCTSMSDERGLWGMVFPSESFVTGGAGLDGACHDVCETGAAMNETCTDPCAVSICQADAFCCENEWDDVCVGQVASVCGATCN